MVSNATFIQLACSFPDVVQLPHFERISFRVNKKIFATLSEEKRQAMVSLSLVDQSVFCSYNKEIIYPVPGKWGTHGYTFIDLRKLPKGMLMDILSTGYIHVASKKM